MPTERPPRMTDPKNVAERIARQATVAFIRKLCNLLERKAYYTRSHMPANLDYTAFCDALHQVVKFCKERPDWTLEILGKLLIEHECGNSLDEI